MEAKGGIGMNTYQVTVGPNGEIIMPSDLRARLALTEGETLEIKFESNKKFSVRQPERIAGPLADFFEDLILNDLQSKGYGGNRLKDQLCLEKTNLSSVLDWLAEEANKFRERGENTGWRSLPEWEEKSSLERGVYHVLLSARAERDLAKLPESLKSEAAHALQQIEHDPSGFKRLRGPYYPIYRLAFNGKSAGQYRIIYTIMENSPTVNVLVIGERKGIYSWLKGLTC